MKILLKHLGIQNFKGSKERDIDFDENVTTISGQNASGKTTILDAYLWLLFNKDSAGNTSFGIRPIDYATGREIDNTEISVEAVLSVDGAEMTLKKIQKQKWTKHRGSTAPSFEGNVNSYEVNGFPVSEKEYRAKIGELISEDNFKLLSELRHFSNLPWKEKKEILLKLCGDVTDEDVLNGDPEYWEPIKADVLAAGTEKAKDKAKKELRELNKTQKELPVRIDELSRQIDDDVPTAGLEKEVEDTKCQISELPERITADTSAEVQELAVIEGKIAKLKDEISNAVCDLRAELRDKEYELKMARGEYEETERTVRAYAPEVERLTKNLNLYKEKYVEAKGRTFDESSAVCKYCGQPLPEEMRNKTKDAFMRSASEDANNALENGKATRAELDRCQIVLKEKTDSLPDMKKRITELANEVANLREKYDAFVSDNGKEGNKEIEALNTRCEELRAEIFIKVNETGVKNKEIDNRRHALMEQLNSIQNDLTTARFINNNNDNIKSRIDEITALQKETGQKIALTEQKVILLEEFSIRKSELLSEKITSQFELVNFSLFNQQINGGITEECEITYRGVKHRDMNSGHRIAVALDIIKTFQSRLGICCPVFVDNAETINSFNLPEMPCQMILLKVSDGKELVVS